MAKEKVTKIRQRPPKHIRADYADPKDPGTHVKLVRDTQKRRQYHERLGYTYVKDEDLTTHDGIVQPDGTVHHGDRVAMKCPKEELEQRQEDHYAEWRAHEATNEADNRREDVYNAGENRRSRGKMFNIPADFLDEGDG